MLKLSRCVCFLFVFASTCVGGLHAQTPPQANSTAHAAPFKTVVYIPVGVTLKMKDRQWLESSWQAIRSQV
ncbi:MAG TPA: hypothetical protein VGC88_03660, partial [Terriglobales bacterium]